jgi:hypothetical protein
MGNRRQEEGREKCGRETKKGRMKARRKETFWSHRNSKGLSRDDGDDDVDDVGEVFACMGNTSSLSVLPLAL